MIEPEKLGSYTAYPFAFGNLLLVKRPKGLFMVKYYPIFSSGGDIMPVSRRELLGITYNPEDFKEEKSLFDRYFQGNKTDFSQLKLDMSAASPFQKKVWAITRKIPYGSTRSYKAVAETMGHKGYRSIGRALHDNPWLIIIPCHRVIRTDGKLGGFGAGLNVKQYLLDLEKQA